MSSGSRSGLHATDGFSGRRAGRGPAVRRVARALPPEALATWHCAASGVSPMLADGGGDRDDLVRSVPVNGSGWPVWPVRAQAGHVQADGNGNELYYWFAPAANAPAGALTPLVIWLNGGPGASSMAGMLWENGPFTLGADGTVAPSAHPWNVAVHMLYWDNPVGTGYSYNPGGDPDCYVRSEREMARQFVTALSGFYARHPAHRSCPLYLAGESYAGKYLPNIAAEILHRNATSDAEPIPLQGVAIGDGWMVPSAQSHDQIAYAYDLGLLDTNQRQTAKECWTELDALIRAGRLAEATALDDALMGYLTACGGGEDLYDVRNFSDLDTSVLGAYLDSPAVKRCFNVPEHVTWQCADNAGPVADALVDDVMVPVDDLIRMLLTYPASLGDIIDWHGADGGDPAGAPPVRVSADAGPVKMLFYTGTFDLSCGFLGTERMLRSLVWEHAEQWRGLSRRVWSGGPSQGTHGYVKQLANLTQVEIAGAGHMVPLTQPRADLDLLDRWIHDLPFPLQDPPAAPIPPAGS